MGAAVYVWIHLGFDFSPCVWIFFNFLNLCHEIVVQNQNSGGGASAFHFLILKGVERIKRLIIYISFIKMWTQNYSQQFDAISLTRMSFATWLFPLPGSPLMMMTICTDIWRKSAFIYQPLICKFSTPLITEGPETLNQ